MWNEISKPQTVIDLKKTIERTTVLNENFKFQTVIGLRNYWCNCLDMHDTLKSSGH